MHKLGFALVLGSASVVGCTMPAGPKPASAHSPPVTVVAAGAEASYSVGDVTITIDGDMTQAMADGVTLRIAMAGGTYEMSRAGDQGITNVIGRDGGDTLYVSATDRDNLKAAADAAGARGDLGLAAVLELIADGLAEGEHPVDGLNQAQVLPPEAIAGRLAGGAHPVLPESTSLCRKAQADSRHPGRGDLVYTSYLSNYYCVWLTCYSFWANAWISVGPRTGELPAGEQCDGRCGLGCSWTWAGTKYTQACANHDECVSDQGTLSPWCDKIFPPAAWDTVHAPNCF
jgi:hypothetical protein